MAEETSTVQFTVRGIVSKRKCYWYFLTRSRSRIRSQSPEPKKTDQLRNTDFNISDYCWGWNPAAPVRAGTFQSIHTGDRLTNIQINFLTKINTGTGIVKFH